MYDSENLPLNKRKILKKTLYNAGSWLAPLLVSAVFVVLGFLSEFDFAFIMAIIAFLFFCFILTLTVLYSYFYYKFYYYNFTEEKAEVRKGVISRATGHVRYERIQNIFVDQDILDRILGLYDVHYETAGERSGFYSHVDGLDKENSEKLVEFLNSKVNSADKTKVSEKNIANSEISQIKNPAASINNEPEPEEIFTRATVAISPKVVYTSAIQTFLTVSIIFILIIFYGGGSLYEAGSVSSSFLGVLFLIGLFIIFAWSYLVSRIWYKNFYFKFDNQLGHIKTQIVSQKNSYVYYDRI